MSNNHDGYGGYGWKLHQSQEEEEGETSAKVCVRCSRYGNGNGDEDRDWDCPECARFNASRRERVQMMSDTNIRAYDTEQRQFYSANGGETVLQDVYQYTQTEAVDLPMDAEVELITPAYINQFFRASSVIPLHNVNKIITEQPIEIFEDTYYTGDGRDGRGGRDDDLEDLEDQEDIVEAEIEGSKVKRLKKVKKSGSDMPAEPPLPNCDEHNEHNEHNEQDRRTERWIPMVALEAPLK